MKVKSALIVGVLMLASLISVTGTATASTDASTGRSAVKAAPLNASAWTPVYLHAYSGNGCASYNADQYLEPITSEPCADSAWWYFRDLNRSSGQIQTGDNLEFVDQTKTYALGYSGGHIKLETPNDNSTFIEVILLSEIGGTGQWQSLWDLQDDAGMVPAGAGNDVGLDSSAASPPDAWLECSTSNPECNGGIFT